MKRCFATDYALGISPAVRDLERSVLGSDYGATSWTTRAEAVLCAELLGLQRNTKLLDVGAGAGWPGLYFAKTTACHVVLTDVPQVAMRLAVERAALDALDERCDAVAADGSALPFADGAFDAISHSDVLCCLPQKQQVLSECRRVARARAAMVFSVIQPAPELSEAQRRLAIDSGPEFVDVAGDYPTLLAQSNWRLEREIDVTDAFTQSIRTSLQLMERNADRLVDALGIDVYRDRVQRRQATLTGLELGVLRRAIYVASA